MTASALDPELLSHCRDAIALLQEAHQLPTPQMIDLTGHAERQVVKVRDDLIRQLREDRGQAPVLRTALEQVNVTLSELSSVEYPGALDRAHLKTASKLLQDLIGDAEPRVRDQLDPLRPAEGISDTIPGVADDKVYAVAATSEPTAEPRPPEPVRLAPEEATTEQPLGGVSGGVEGV